LNRAQESRDLVVKRKGEKIELKLETAEQLRQKAINLVQEKAKKECTKVVTAKEKVSQDAIKKGEKIDSKLETAEQLRQKALNLVQEKAKKECSKIITAKEKLCENAIKKGE